MSAGWEGRSEPYRISLRPLTDVALIIDFVDLDPQTFANPRWNTQRCRDRYGRDHDGIAGARSGVIHPPRSDEGHTQFAARSVASHPVSPAPILAAVHPEPPEKTLTDP